MAIEIVGHSTIKEPRRGVADTPTTIPNDATGATGARTRTDRLLDQQEARRQQAREGGKYDLDIIDRWQCPILTAPMRMASALSIEAINTVPLWRRSLSYGVRQWLPVSQVLPYYGLLPGYTTSGRMGAVR